MKIHRLMVWALVSGVAAFLLAFSDNFLAAYWGTLQDKTKRPADATPSTAVQPSAKSGLLIKPAFRISETPSLSGDRRAGLVNVAFNPDDNEYLVVWESDGLTEVSGVSDIYGQRLSGNTNERIGIPFRISNLTDRDKNHTSNDPKVVYNLAAHEYLVVWNGSGLFTSPDIFFEVYGQRLGRTGKEIGADFRISHTTDLGKINTSFVRSSSQADVAWNSANNEYLVVWKGMGEPEDVVKMEIYGQRLKANGELLGKSFRISHTTNQGINFNANAPAIAHNSRANQYLVVWSGGFKKESQVEVWGMGLSAAGDSLGPKNDFRISQVNTDVGSNRDASFPHVVYNSVNNEYFVVFQANAARGEGTAVTADIYEIFGQRIEGTTFAEIGANDFRISSTSRTGAKARRPDVTFNSVTKEYLVIWRSILQNAPSEIFGQRINSDGAEIEADFQISNITTMGNDRRVNDSTLTQNTQNGDYLVVWQGNGLSGTNSAKTIEIFGQQLVLLRPQPR